MLYRVKKRRPIVWLLLCEVEIYYIEQRAKDPGTSSHNSDLNIMLTMVRPFAANILSTSLRR